jgi:acyl-CoA thioesterase-2
VTVAQHRIGGPLQLARTETGMAFGWCHAGAPGRAFGGQVAGHALAAAGATAGERQRVLSLHARYVGPGDPDRVVEYHVERLHDGRSFCTRVVRATQLDTVLALVTVSFAIERPAGPEASKPMPVVPSPECTAVTPFEPTPSGRAFNQHVEQRIIVDAGNIDTGTPMERRWMKMARTLGASPIAQAAGLTYLSDIRLASTPAAGIRAAGMRLAVTTLDHTVWWHRPSRSDEWLLFDQSGISLSAGIALSTADLYTAEGDLVASTAQQALIRVVPAAQ